MNVQEGDVVAGKYRIERVLGQGAMGVVVAARHLQLEQRVALKFLLSEAMQHPEAIARFAREARAAAAIRSEHVARVIDVGTLESGMPYMVMEYLEGQDLSQYMGERGPLSVAEASALTLQACEALAEAHSLGIIHRDLKPANLFLAHYADRTSLKILDFGISKIAPSGSAAPDFEMTRMGAVMGSPIYMSPEQMRSTRNVDARTDIWALGVVLYELVAGRAPFQAPTMPQLCGLILADPPPPLKQWRTDVPIRFESLILRCLEKEPARRFPSVADLAVALAEFAPPQAAPSVDRILKLARAAAMPAGRQIELPPETVADHLTHSSFGRTAQRNRSRSRWGIVAAVTLLGLAAAWLVLGRSGGSLPRPDAALPERSDPVTAPVAAGPNATSPPLPAPPTEVEAPPPTPAKAIAGEASAAPHASAVKPAKPPKRSAVVASPPRAASAAASITTPPPASPLPTPLDGRL